MSIDAGAAVSGSARVGAPAKLEHAFLALFDPPRKPGTLKLGDERDRIEFQFNPAELSAGRQACWGRDRQPANRSGAVPHYLGSEPRSLTLQLLLDSSAPPTDSVVTRTEKLFECCVPTAQSLTKQKASPPWVRFHWGAQEGFPAYIEQVAVTYTLFTPSGLPIRATATVTLQEITLERTGTNPTSGGPPARSVHTVLAGDTLAGVAWQEYGDPSRWRTLARANDIDDPMRLRPGRVLLVPAAAEDASAGG